MEEMQTERPKRNYGIDLLRVVSMIMIALLHTMNRGGISDALPAHSMRYATGWLLKIAAYGAVDCYALISGYVSYGRKHRASSLIYLYFQALFYTVLSTALTLVFHREDVGIRELIATLLPFAYDTYWYFTAYFCLFFFMSAFDRIVDILSRRNMTRLVIALFAIFSFLPTVLHSDIATVDHGYSFVWLAALYIFGAYIKKYSFTPFKHNVSNLLGYAVCVLITWCSKLVIERLTEKLPQLPINGYYLVEYHSFTVLLGAIFLLLFFRDLRCGKAATAIAKFFAPVSFGAYLFHESPFIREYLITDAFADYAALNSVLLPLAALGTAVLIWLISSLADRLRLLLFKLCRVRSGCERLGERFDRMADRLADKLMPSKK